MIHKAVTNREGSALKKFLYLTHLEISRLLKPLIALLVLLILFQQVLLSIAGKNTYDYIPYEAFFAASGAEIVFYLAFAAACGLCIQSVLSNYHGGKSIYTLMTLPQDRSRVHFSKLLSGMAVFLLLICAQWISAILGYALSAPKIQKVVGKTGPYGTEFIWEHAKNGLFLAFIRSGFFRLLFPLDPESLISTVAVLTGFLCGLYYGILCERSGKHIRILPVAAQIGYIIYILNYRLNTQYSMMESRILSLHSVILFASAGFFLWDSIRLVRRGAIL